MRLVTFSDARQSLKKVIDGVCDDREPVVIHRSRGGDAVLLSLEEYESMTETLHLLNSPANAGRLRAAVTELDAGKGRERLLPEA